MPDLNQMYTREEVDAVVKSLNAQHEKTLMEERLKLLEA